MISSFEDTSIACFIICLYKKNDKKNILNANPSLWRVTFNTKVVVCAHNKSETIPPQKAWIVKPTTFCLALSPPKTPSREKRRHANSETSEETLAADSKEFLRPSVGSILSQATGAQLQHSNNCSTVVFSMSRSLNWVFVQFNTLTEQSKLKKTLTPTKKLDKIFYQ